MPMHRIVTIGDDVTACGLSLDRVDASSEPQHVTCRRCLAKLRKLKKSTTREREIAEAFADGRFYLLIDEPQPRGTIQSAFIGEEEVPALDAATLKPILVRLIHVMSKPAGGEIRSYVLAGDGKLRLRLPCYQGVYAELDAAVELRVTGAVTTAPYEADDTGAVRVSATRKAVVL